MHDAALTDTYTALAQAIARVGPERTPLMLATLSLALLAREPEAGAVSALIAQAERLAQR